MTTSVDVDNNRIDHHPDGIQEDFTYDFQVNYQTWMFAYADGVLYEEVFTMTGIGDPVGGLVQYAGNPPPDTIETLTLIRVIPLTQTIVYPPYGPFPPKSHEGALDKLTWITQQMQEELDRSWKNPIDGEGGDFYMPTPEAGKTLQWNESEDGLENGPSEGDFQGWLDQSQDAAERSGASAYASQESAEASFSWVTFANQWSSADINVEVDDGIHPIGYSAYHWAQMAAEGGIIELTSQDTEMLQIDTPVERFREVRPIVGTPGGMIKLNDQALIDFEYIPFDGALRLAGLIAGHNRCPKEDVGFPEGPCAEPDYRNPSERWPTLEFKNGDWMVIIRNDEAPDLNQMLLIVPGDPNPSVTTVEDGDGIVYIGENEQGLTEGWYHNPGMAARGGLAQNISFDDTNTTVKGTNVQLWNQNLDQIVGQEGIRRDGTIPMIADLDFPAESGIRGWGNGAGEYLDLLLTNAVDEAVLGILTNHPHVPTLPDHLVNKAYVDAISAPVGAIIMWHGALADIPTGWGLCDGTQGTPDLLDKFITQVATAATEPGDEGGSKVISVAQLPVHGHTATVGSLATGNFNAAHTHTYSTRIGTGGPGGAGPGVPNTPSTPATGSGLGNHSHAVSGAPAIGNTGSGAESLPPFYALAFIMKLA